VNAVHTPARIIATALAYLLALSGLSLALGAGPAHAAGPTIIGPADEQVVNTIPTLQWTRLPDATKYDVQVSTSNTFTATLLSTSTVNSQYTPTIQLPVGDLFWRVRVNGSGDAGWSTAQFERAQVAAPEMLGPTGGLQQPDSPPLIQWTSVPGAKKYFLQVSPDDDFADPSRILSYTATTTTSAINPSLVTPNTYYARVRAELANGVFTPFATPISYTINGLLPVTRTSPPSNGSVTDVVLDWNPLPGAATYQLQIDDDSNFSSLLVDVGGIRGTRYSPPATIGNNTYFWRVRPIDAGGNARAWSDSDRSTFQRAWPGQVRLQYPADGAFVGNPFFFQWSPSARTSTSQEDLALASSYTLELSTSATFQGDVARCTTVLTTYVPQDTRSCFPAASGTYYWRVIGHDDFGGARPSSDVVSAEVRSFTYSPEVPDLISPINGDTVSIPTLNWTPVAGAARYRVSITTPGGGNITATTASTAYTPEDILTPGSYSWQVQTLSNDNRLGTSFIFDSGAFVVVDQPAPVATTPEPTNTPASRRFPTLTWTPVVGAVRYEVWAKPVASTGYTLIGDDFAYPAAESTDDEFLDPGSYDWFVKPIAENGSAMPRGSDGTFTINPLEVIPDDQQYAALAGTFLPDDPESADDPDDLDQDACRTQLLVDEDQSECDALRNTPVLRWAAKPNVGYYLLYVANDQEMTNPVYDRRNDGVFDPIVVNQPMWSPTDALPDSEAGTAYYYRVVPCSYGQCEALAHAQHSFDKLSRSVVLKPAQHTPVGTNLPVACPIGSNPPLQTCQNDVTLSWQDYWTTEQSADPGNVLAQPGRTEARNYIVQTATDENFQSLIETREVDQTTFTSISTTYPEGDVYWRVRAADGSENLLPWSATGKFEKKSPVPVLSAPANDETVGGDLFLAWESLPFAATYRIEMYKNDDRSASSGNQMFNPTTVGQRMVSFTGRFPQLGQNDGDYVWRVRRIDAAARAGGWSEWGNFRITEPTTTLGDPAVDAAVEPSDALFTWSTVPGAESYRFERRLDGNLTPAESVQTRALTWAPQAAIPGGAWQWRVTPIDGSGNLMTPTDWRDFTVDDTVVATSPVQITGSGRTGTPVTATTPPSWNFGGSVITTYQWLRDSKIIGGATGTSYEMTSADLGKDISVRATGTRAGYIGGTSTSNVIVGIAGDAPVAVVGVSVSGAGKVNTVLTATPPEWDSDAVTTSYQWRRDGTNVNGATGSSYALTAADVGKSITVRATGARPGYTSGASVSDPVVAEPADAPVATTDVSISGGPKVGSTLTLTAPTWDTPSVTTSYQWYRDDAPITGATKTTYKLVEADIGTAVTVVATGSKSGYTPGQSVSNEVVVEQLDALEGTAGPTISGIAAARETLTADPGSWPTGTTFTYQWFVDGVAVARETRDRYVVRTRDAGLPVKVRVIASKAGFLSAEEYSPEMKVARLATTITASLQANPISRRARAVVLVKVGVLDLGVPLGNVEIRRGTKVLARTVLKSDSRGNLTIRLKKLPPGKHKLKVRYTGSSSTAPSKAKGALKLIVLKR
jgi:hypothetical protein